MKNMYYMESMYYMKNMIISEKIWQKKNQEI